MEFKLQLHRVVTAQIEGPKDDHPAHCSSVSTVQPTNSVLQSKDTQTDSPHELQKQEIHQQHSAPYCTLTALYTSERQPKVELNFLRIALLSPTSVANRVRATSRGYMKVNEVAPAKPPEAKLAICARLGFECSFTENNFLYWSFMAKLIAWDGK